MTKMLIEVTKEQAEALKAATELYLRVGIGQLNYVSELARMDLINVAEFKREKGLSIEEMRDLDHLMDQAKRILGYSPGASAGIGNRGNHITVLRSHEINKVLSKALANLRNPNPEFRGVDYDGLSLRYTDDPAPRIEVLPESSETEQ